MQIGTVANFNPQRGFGFIKRRGERDVFFHITAVQRTPEGIGEGDEVSFEVEDTERGPRAADVRVIKTGQ